MHTLRAATSTLLAVFMLLASPAFAWNVDYFAKDASGAATYEDMAIRPQAVYDPGTDRTYIVYQGHKMDPYVMAYDHGHSTWLGPYKVGSNPLGLNTHGGPSLVVEPSGHLIVFFGGHNGPLLHARSRLPGSIGQWHNLGAVTVRGESNPIPATYPQPVIEADGTMRLYYRRSGTGPQRGNWQSVTATYSAKGELGWEAPEHLIFGSSFNSAEPTTTGSHWYVNVDYHPDHGTAVAAVRRDLATSNIDFRIRRGVYYLERSHEGTWTAAGGAAVDPIRDRAALEPTATAVPEYEGSYTNQVVVRRGPDGGSGILYLAGTHQDDVYEWRFARWDGARWIDVAIATTDNFFDAGTFEFLDDGGIEAFLTTGGVPDDQWYDDPATKNIDESSFATRGGDITQWRSADNGSTWEHVRDVITSPGAYARYNNPQIIDGGSGSARLVFSEWNNDASSFIHKVYLWGDDGFVQHRFTPAFHRLAGDTRVLTAIEVSRQSFPAGAEAVVIASAEDYPDALCGVPLAHALRAPVLLSGSGRLQSSVAEEIARLRPKRIAILGGESAIGVEVERALRALRDSRGLPLAVERISGADRYETSAAIARRLVDYRGYPARAVLASGTGFADALVVSPYAARKGYPVLLTPAATARSTIRGVLAELGPEGLIVVGGEAVITTSTAAAYESEIGVGPSARWAGENRYETARIVAQRSLEGGHSLERPVVVNGESFADAIGGGVLAARNNGVLLTTPATRLHPAIEDWVSERAYAEGTGVLDVYVLGGPSAVSPDVSRALAALLMGAAPQD